MRIFVLTLLMFFSFASVYASENEYYGIGITTLRDSFSKKTFVNKVFAGSPAFEQNLKTGSEIIEINSLKTKKHSEKEINDMLTDEAVSRVTLLIKENRQKKLYDIPLRRMTLPPVSEKDKTFDLHWKQVVPEKYENPEYISEETARKVSGNYYSSVIRPTNYWYKRKQVFQTGYNACMSYSSSVKDMCLMNLVNREISKTENDRNNAIQKQLLFQQELQNSNLQRQNFELQRLNNNSVWRRK